MSSIEKLDPNFAAPTLDNDTAWYDLRALAIEGRAWADEPRDHEYHRFPARAKGNVPEVVYNLAACSAGVYVRFTSDATNIAVRWTLLNANAYMAHMPPTGYNGFDLYVESNGTWRYAGVARPEKDQVDQQAVVADALSEGKRHYMLYLPLYNGVTQAHLGLPKDAVLEPAPAWPRADAKPILFYGTSIVHGGCASRPGMCYSSILSRKLNHPAINMGFSGNGKCQPGVDSLLAELDPSIYVLDPLPNLDAPGVNENCESFIRTLRAARPDTPIVMVDMIRYQDAHVKPARANRIRTTSEAWRTLHDALLASGMTHLHWIPSDNLLGDDDEATVDGTHFTDLGYLRFAEALEPTLGPLL